MLFGRIDFEDSLNNNSAAEGAEAVGCGGPYLDFLSRRDTRHTKLAKIIAQEVKYDSHCIR